MNWNILQLEVKPYEGNLTDVVITAEWTLADTQGEYSASIGGSVTFPAPSGDFTPYEDLTKEQVLGWVWENGVDKDETEAGIAKAIEAQANPAVVIQPLPWVTEAPAEEAVEAPAEESTEPTEEV